MNSPSHRPNYLAALTAALDEPGTDLQAILDVLVDDLTAAIPSFLGLAITIEANDDPVVVTAIDPDLTGATRASMSVPLDLVAGVPGVMVLYARAPGAFVDLAADTRHAFNLDGQVTVDAHLDPTEALSGAVTTAMSIEDSTVVNRAIGVLVALGHPPEQARIQLARQANDHGQTLRQAAQTILDSTPTPRPT